MKDKIAIEINGVRYEKEVGSSIILLSDFASLFEDASMIQEGDNVRGVDKSEEYMLDR